MAEVGGSGSFGDGEDPGGGGPRGDQGPDGDDPFDQLLLDDAFVRGAAHHEASATDRVARLQRIDREHRRLKAERTDELAARRKALAKERRRSRRRGWRGVVVLFALAGVLVFLNYRNGKPNVVSATDALIHGSVDANHRPPPSSEERDAPISVAAAVPAGTGPFTFIEQQPSSANPVAYDPCRPLHVVVSSRTAPPSGATLVQEAVGEVSTLTGLQIVIDGPTDEAPSPDRPAYQPDRYPDRWAPVLIAWSDPNESPDLASDVAGRGGSSALAVPGTGTVYVTGEAVLDGPQLTELIDHGDAAGAKAVILHELGHVVGLGHVSDPTQIMNPEGSADVSDFAVGDRLGLAQLGRGACFPGV